MSDLAGHVPVSTAARLVGVNERTIRRWISAGRLPDMPGQVGGQRVRLVDLATVRLLAEASDIGPAPLPDQARVPARSPDVPGADDRTAPDGAGQESDVSGIPELVALVREQQQTILELAGRTGWLQAKLQEAEGRMQDLEQELRLLKAPTAAAADMPADQVPAETTNHPTEPENGPDSASYTRRSRPWWHFWAFW